jgi:hypothetical protein
MIACTAIARVAVVIALVGVLGISQPAKDALPPCVRVMIALEDDIDSAHARPDDAFRFVTVDDARLRDGTSVPAGSIGHGIVAISQHAERGGRGGYLVLDARFVALASGPHIPAAIDWSLATRATATGASMNIPGIVGAIPFAGYFLGPYGFIHHGKDVIIPRGAQLPVVLGDELAAGTCKLTPPAPLPSPTPAAAASPMPSSDSATMIPNPSSAPMPSSDTPPPAVTPSPIPSASASAMASPTGAPTSR